MGNKQFSQGGGGSHQEPPWFPLLLINLTCPRSTKTYLIGDLIEGFEDRVIADPKEAVRWFRKQCLSTSMHYISGYVVSESFLRIAMITLSVFLVGILAIFISWLSLADGIEPILLTEIIEGKVHLLLQEGDVFFEGIRLFLEDPDLSMFIYEPAVLWSIFCLLVLYYKDKNTPLNAHQIAGFGLLLMALPYIGGLLYITMFQPPLNKVGPIIAFMVLPFIYLAFPITIWSIKRTCKPPD